MAEALLVVEKFRGSDVAKRKTVIDPLEVFGEDLHDERLPGAGRTHQQDILSECVFFMREDIHRKGTVVEVVEQETNHFPVVVVNNELFTLLTEKFVSDGLDGEGVIHIHVVVGQVIGFRTVLSSPESRSPPVF